MKNVLQDQNHFHPFFTFHYSFFTSRGATLTLFRLRNSVPRDLRTENLFDNPEYFRRISHVDHNALRKMKNMDGSFPCDLLTTNLFPVCGNLRFIDECRLYRRVAEVTVFLSFDRSCHALARKRQLNGAQWLWRRRGTACSKTECQKRNNADGETLFQAATV